ncbi:hypothetical protein BJ138DRAFT_1017424 [Hygrophoropsis aurantiaca]|uniref:Uncharacterized protein n=1 Tax=Hygrophoropsis aurantiaca TaxID=72124 RepID=A0ACB7ZXQ1_9AGAM|nr:hypothetical protein BJ138DRAFT_1017424 [Hygrophoropsis aurantiaca]
MLRTHSSVVSGSVALHYFDPSERWRPDDMDIYVPAGRRKRVLLFLETAGYYTVDRGRAIKPDYGDNCGVISVTTVCNGDKTIDVISSCSHISIAPIVRFHLSAVMNFLSADGFFCAYPSLTAERRAICNSTPFGHGQPSPSTVHAYVKYAHRGYTLRRSPLEFDNSDHICRRNMLCPLMVRNTFDAGCMVVYFRAGLTAVRQAAGVDIVKYLVVWQMGDKDCKTGERYGSTHAFAFVKVA